MQLNKRVTLRGGLLTALGVFAIAFTVGVSLHSVGWIPVDAVWFDPVVNRGLGC